ncbi:MAG TPA: dipeptide epimerase [Candidatus Aminicenantes bacterium]|nr:dipeptide epimerase [Candidatus Aminicenantes bacterium]HRY65622.1 dipeptide epimerase [Candidatus Aminicenantes bacterium]HRZ72490.1 dipeptide epimerase [Candidatus Aminicenantes bacterium]
MTMISRKDFLKTLALGFAGAGALGRRGLAAGLDQAAAGGLGRRVKITGVDIYPMDLAIKEPFRIAIGTITAANDILVRVRTDAGIIGIGEACPAPPITGETQAGCLAAARDIRTLLIGRDPTAVESAVRAFAMFLHTAPSVVAAYDMALYDIVGQMAGLPVFRLLGGDKASFETDRTVSLAAPEAMAAKARAFRARGFRTIKVKVGQDPATDVDRVAAVREAVGPEAGIRIDANQGWSVPQAVWALQRMEPFRIQFAEQPVVAWDLAGLKAVKDRSPVPIMADEACFRPEDALKLVQAEACHYINIKLMKAGGIFNSVRISHIAESANVACMVGCMNESRVALTAAVHVVASQRNILFADLDGNEEHLADPVVDGFTIRDGEIIVPEKPGLGVDVDPAFLKTLKKI